MGLVSFPYCSKFNGVFKEKIRGEFNRECFICGLSEELNGKKLPIHHVNYNKDCLCDDSFCYFVPLCNSCHSRTNNNREFWEKLLTNCCEDQEMKKYFDNKNDNPVKIEDKSVYIKLNFKVINNGQKNE